MRSRPERKLIFIFDSTNIANVYGINTRLVPKTIKEDVTEALK